MNLPPKIATNVEVSPDGCWLWTGYCDPKGYARVAYPKPRRAHRVVYELLVGKPLSGHHLHHTCHVKRCVNPEHLQLLTPSEHAATHGHNGTHCSHGHEWTPENTYVRCNGERQCRACKNAVEKRRVARMTPERRAAMIARSSERRRQRRDYELLEKP